MRWILFLSMLFCNLGVIAQTGRESRIDSLENVLSKKIHDTTRTITMSELARSYGGVDSVKCFDYGFKAIELSQKMGYLKGLAKAHIELAGAYLDYAKNDKAIYHYEKGNQFADKLIRKDSTRSNMKIWLRGLYNLGVAHGYNGNISKEIELATKTIPIAERMGDKMYVANGNTNLGIKYNNLGNFSDAYDLFVLSQKQFEEIGEPEDMVFHGVSFTSCLFALDSFPKMKEVLDRTKKNLDQIPNSFYAPIYYAELGLYFGGVGEYGKGIAALDKASSFYNPNVKNYYQRTLNQRYSDMYKKIRI